eukprot:Platyproteum_vivax@DN1533_c0_g1_i1.p1
MAVLDQAYLRNLLNKNSDIYYYTAELNEKLFLHQKGFPKIQCLDIFPQLRVLHLDGNAIKDVENLEYLTSLRCLYLHDNLISTIQGLEKLTQLHTLTLSNNYISKIENINAYCPLLHSLDIAKNKLQRVDDVLELADMKSVSVLNISNNQIDDPAFVTEVLANMPSLAVLYMKGNPLIEKIENYRKWVIQHLPNLKYLDDRPVFEKDRRLAVAFWRGGVEEERRERRLIEEEKEQERLRQHEEFRRLTRGGMGFVERVVGHVEVGARPEDTDGSTKGSGSEASWAPSSEKASSVDGVLEVEAAIDALVEEVEQTEEGSPSDHINMLELDLDALD